MTILCWCKNPEEGAIKQAENIEKHPWLFGNVCLMPDTHEGYGMPIGGVVALKDAVCPNMVGVDIGCGMLAVKTSLTDITTEELKNVLGGTKENKGGIRARIPVGFDHQKKDVEHPIFDDPRWEDTFICEQEFESAKRQLGTLGGGNHFIEIQKGDDGHIWFMIHSGSRNLGYKVAKHYNDIAKTLCTEWKQDEIVKNDLAVLPTHTDEFTKYFDEMSLCVDFSYANREVMSSVIIEEFKRVFPEMEVLQEVNISHNYASIENHFGRNVYVHRKGATLARKGILGIIPGSQGTSSYIVEGLGNPKSMCSCSHGAGRKMSRKKAVENLNLEEEQAKLDEKGILHSLRYKKSLDEAPSAYKDIYTVMEEQKDLVKILVKLQPLAVIKG